MWHLTPPTQVIPANGYVVIYGKNEHRINQIIKFEAEMHSCLQNRIIRLNLEQKDMWHALLIGVIVIGCWGIAPYVLEEHGAIINGLY